MAKDSAEYRTIIDLTSELRLAVQSELISLSGSLLASRLISPEGDAELRNTAHSEVERSAKLVELVQSKVGQNPRHYHSFIGILQGNQDQYGDILQQLEHTYQEQQQEDSAKIVDVDTGIVSHIHDLESQFRQLHESLLTELEEKRVSTTKLLRFLTLLPIEIRLEYKSAISEMFPDLRRESTISDLFYHLSPLVDFLSYGLLKYVIDVFGSNTLKKMIASYSDDVLIFIKKTTVKQLMDVWPGQQDIPPNFSKLRAKLDEHPSKYTLYDLEQLRKCFCSGVKLTDVVLVLIGLEAANSFIVEWLIPSALVPQLMESAKQLEFGFYLQEHILKMSVDEKPIFPLLPDAKPKVLAFQAAAATVTDLPDPDTEPISEQAITQPSSSVKQPKSLPGIRDIDELRFCALYSGVGVICDHWPLDVDPWKSVEPHLSSLGYTTISDFPIYRAQFTTIAQSIQPPTDAELSDSHSFVIALFLSGTTRDSGGGFIDDIIHPFLPQSAPHLQHIPKLFFVTACVEDLHAPPPYFPDDPDGNYCVAYHVKKYRILENLWAEYITNHIFLPSTTVEGVIENSRSRIEEKIEHLHYFTCLKNKLVLKK